MSQSEMTHEEALRVIFDNTPDGGTIAVRDESEMKLVASWNSDAKRVVPALTKPPASFFFEPLDDKVLVREVAKPDKVGVVFVPGQAFETAEGIVVAVGRGRINASTGMRDRLTVNIGDHVVWHAPQGQMTRGWPITVNDEKYVILLEVAILGIRKVVPNASS